MQFKVVVLLATILVAQQVQACTINFDGNVNEISQVPVAGEEENYVETTMPETLNILSDMADGLGDLANAITSLSAEQDYVQAQPSNLIGNLLGGVGDALGRLANPITQLSVQIQAVPKTRSVSSSGAAIIGELGNISAKEIASAAQAAAPYVKKLNAALGDLANALTHL